MADPREVGPQARKANLSPLMTAMGRQSKGEIVNFCPFRCPDHHLDELGYCRHLVGFTKQGRLDEEGRPVKDVRSRATGKVRLMDVCMPPDAGGRRVTLGGGRGAAVDHRKPLEKGDVLIRITNTWRVYREAGCYPAPEDDDEDDLDLEPADDGDDEEPAEE